MVYKGKGGAGNDQSDTGCKGNRQIHVGTCMFLLSKKVEVCRYVYIYMIISGELQLELHH